MDKSKLIKFIAQLSAKDQARFKDYLNSPYFNKNDTVIKFFTLIHKKIKKKPASFSKEKTFNSLFPGKPFNEQIIKNLQSALMSHLISFMGMQQYQIQPIRNHLDALEYGLDTEMFEFIDFNKKRALKYLGNKMNQQIENELYLFQFYNIMCRKELATKNKAMEEQKMLDYLESYQIGSKLKIFCEIYSDSKKSITPNIALESIQLQSYIKKHWEHFENNLLITIYFHLLSLYLSEGQKSVQAFSKLRSEIGTFKDKLSILELEEIYTHLENYCMRSLNLGKLDYNNELFTLYKEQLEIPKLRVRESKYNNITGIGCHLGELEWVASFLEKRKEDLPAKNRENVYLYNLAKVASYKLNYDKALELLNQIDLSTGIYYRGVKFALIKIYYEKEEFEPILYTLESFRIYIIRNKKTFKKKRLLAINNFIKIVEKLVKIRMSSFAKKDFLPKQKMLLQQVQETEFLINRNWLIEKLSTL